MTVHALESYETWKKSFMRNVHEVPFLSRPSGRSTECFVVRSLPAELHHDLDGIHLDVAELIFTILLRVDNRR